MPYTDEEATRANARLHHGNVYRWRERHGKKERIHAQDASIEEVRKLVGDLHNQASWALRCVQTEKPANHWASEAANELGYVVSGLDYAEEALNGFCETCQVNWRDKDKFKYRAYKNQLKSETPNLVESEVVNPPSALGARVMRLSPAIVDHNTQEELAWNYDVKLKLVSLYANPITEEDIEWELSFLDRDDGRRLEYCKPCSGDKSHYKITARKGGIIRARARVRHPKYESTWSGHMPILPGEHTFNIESWVV